MHAQALEFIHSNASTHTYAYSGLESGFTIPYSFLYTLSPRKIEMRSLYDLLILSKFYDHKNTNYSYDDKKYAFSKIDHYIAIAHGTKGFQIFNTHTKKFSLPFLPRLTTKYNLQSKFIDVISHNNKFIFLVDSNSLDPYPNSKSTFKGFYVYDPYTREHLAIPHYTESGVDSLEKIKNNLIITSFMPVINYDLEMISQGISHFPIHKEISLAQLGRFKKGKLFTDEYYAYACLQDTKTHTFKLEVIDLTKIIF